MPLEKSKSKKAIGHNIEKEEMSGKGHKQAVAIALSVARKAGAKIPKSKGKKVIMFEIIEKISPVLKLLEENYSQQDNVRNAIIDSLISILKNHKIKQSNEKSNDNKSV